MNPRKSLFIASVVTVLIVIGLTFYGCGRSNERPTKSYGADNDAAYRIVNTEVHSFVDSAMQFVQSGFNTMSAYPGSDEYNPDDYKPGDSLDDPDPDIQIRFGPAAGDSVTATYRYTNGWHVVTYKDIAGSSTIDLKDSIRFQNEFNIPLQDSDSLISLIYKHHWSVSKNDTTVSHSDLSGHIDYSILDLNSTVTTIAGTISWIGEQKLVTADSTVWTTIEVEATITSMQVLRANNGWTQSCPSNGSILATATMTRQKDNGTPVVTTWTITISFNTGHVYVKQELGETVWLDDWQSCTPPQI